MALTKKLQFQEHLKGNWRGKIALVKFLVVYGQKLTFQWRIKERSAT